MQIWDDNGVPVAKGSKDAARMPRVEQLKLVPFGSYISNLFIDTSDVDLSIEGLVNGRVLDELRKTKKLDVLGRPSSPFTGIVLSIALTWD